MATVEQSRMLNSWFMRFNEERLNTGNLPQAIPASSLSLTEEIRQLRLLMEQVANEEESFTSKHVIEISILLDKKLNEYMNLSNRKQTER